MTDELRPLNELSPGGRYRWDGRSWQPVAPPEPPVTPPASAPHGGYGDGGQPAYGFPAPLPGPQPPGQPTYGSGQPPYSFGPGPQLTGQPPYFSGPPPYGAGPGAFPGHGAVLAPDGTWHDPNGGGPWAYPLSPPTPVVTDGYAWGMALVGVGSTLVLIASAVTGSLSPVIFGTIASAVSIGLGVVDVQRVRAAGVKASYALAILLPFVYLFVRASRLGRGLPIAFTSLASMIVSFVAGIAAVLLIGLPLDLDELERQIEAQALAEAGITLEVTCPKTVDTEVGATFACTVLGPDGERLVIDVEVTSNDGDVVWELRP